MQIHRQQGRATKQGAVVTVKLSWKSGDAAPVLDQTQEYPQFAALTGENEAGWPNPAAVNTAWLGEISTYDPERGEVTVITPYHVKEVLPAAAVIDPADIGHFVFQGQKVLPYVGATHDAKDIAGIVLTAAAAPDDPVWVLRS